MDIFGMEKLSLVDYDGHVAATVFTGKCNFRCGFCHNSPLVLDSERLSALNEKDVLDFLEKRKNILDGICITGGEPTLNRDLPEFCEKLKKIGYSVKVDTNGTNPQMIRTLFENGLCDYFAMDIKNDKDDYAEIIGFDKYDTSSVEKSVEYFLSSPVDYEFRTTLIAEYHKKDNILKIGEWIKGAKKYFLQKYKHTDDCISQSLHGVEEKLAADYVSLLKTFVPHTGLRGY